MTAVVEDDELIKIYGLYNIISNDFRMYEKKKKMICET